MPLSNGVLLANREIALLQQIKELPLQRLENGYGQPHVAFG